MAKPKVTRAQRKEGAKLRDDRRTAERLRRQKASRRKPARRTLGGRIRLRMHSWSRSARRGIVATVVLVAALTVWWAAEDSATHTAEDTHLVRTVPTREVQVVNRSSDWFAPTSGPPLDVDIDGKPVRLGHGVFDARDLSVGNMITVVVNPTDNNHVVAVGAPGDRDDTASDWVVTAVSTGVAAALLAAVVSAVLLGPELEAWEEKRRTMQRDGIAATAFQGARRP
ncbi:hypothetical protein ACSYDW_03345 [Paeniglutamicibacter sp. R2-26]|uniref:hypothetical protein n=1 Tax=Paeniglutamicibacter sp. R2-26 TaxID=3144417 RepID=UPI003EE4B74A